MAASDEIEKVNELAEYEKRISAYLDVVPYDKIPDVWNKQSCFFAFMIPDLDYRQWSSINSLIGWFSYNVDVFIGHEWILSENHGYHYVMFRSNFPISLKNLIDDKMLFSYKILCHKDNDKSEQFKFMFLALAGIKVLMTNDKFRFMDHHIALVKEFKKLSFEEFGKLQSYSYMQRNEETEEYLENICISDLAQTLPEILTGGEKQEYDADGNKTNEIFKQYPGWQNYREIRDKKMIPAENHHLTLFHLISDKSAFYLVNRLCECYTEYTFVSQVVKILLDFDFDYIDKKAGYEYVYITRVWKEVNGLSKEMVKAYCKLIADYIYFHYRPFLGQASEVGKSSNEFNIKLEQHLSDLQRVGKMLANPSTTNSIHDCLISLYDTETKGASAKKMHGKYYTVGDWIPFKNCINVNILTGEIRQRMKGDFFTMTFAIDYVVDTELIKWVKEYVRGLSCFNDAKYRFLLKQAVEILIGSNRYKRFFMSAAESNMGKSFWYNLIHEILGDYSIHADPAIFTIDPKGGRSAKDNTGTLSTLKNRRFILLDDSLEPGKIFNITFVKNWTSPGHSVNVMDKYGNPYQMLATGVIIIIMNFTAILEGINNDSAVKNRLTMGTFELMLVEKNHWDIKLTDEQRNSGKYGILDWDLYDKMHCAQILQAIAQLIITEGARMYNEDTQKYGTAFPHDAEQDELFNSIITPSSVRDWINIIAVPSPGCHINTDTLAKQWRQDFGGAKTPTILGKELRKDGFLATVQRGWHTYGLTGGEEAKRLATSLVGYTWSGKHWGGQKAFLPGMTRENQRDMLRDKSPLKEFEDDANIASASYSS